MLYMEKLFNEMCSKVSHWQQVIGFGNGLVPIERHKPQRVIVAYFSHLRNCTE